mgnify:CR=1 FL=1
MASSTVHFYGEALQKASAFDIILPDGQWKGPFPTMYLLHGLSDDHTIWRRNTSIERYAAGLPLVIVMPDTHRQFYADSPDGYPYEQHIIRDVIGFVESRFNVVRKREGRAISGLSMGGYGAMMLGLKHWNLFASIASHSAVFKPWSMEHREELQPEILRIFGQSPDGGFYDPYALAESCPEGQRPQIRFDCGTDDFLLEQNQAFHRFLNSKKIKHTYKENPGAHRWEYWDAHIQESIAFHWKALAATAPVIKPNEKEKQ